MTKIIDSIKDLVADIKTVQTAGSHLSESLTTLEKSLSDTEVQLDEINKSIDEFKFKTQPRLDHIKELQKSIQTELNKFQ